MFTLHYAILCTTMDLSGASCITLCTYRIYYTTISSLYFICNGFSHFYYLLSQLFLFFKCYFLLYIYILWFHILLSLRCFGSAFLYMAVLFLFSFALLMWKSLFSADNSFFVVQLYIGISPIILFKNLTLFMCRNLLVRHYYLSCLCLYNSLCARISMLVDPQHQYIVFLRQFLKGGFYTGKNRSTSYRRDHLQQQKEVSTLAKREILVSLLPFFYAYYPNSSAGVFRCLCKERLLHRKNQL